ncbi:hypothetical protein [Neorhodopirellula pilleata]|uniref:hypothetical protein n=1 Tax=Neorhodopirellula pilleata TaxID=2714738 RepID=UPI0018CC8994|nr:hypothetical protein [Neorhodopirellula pilleata]
MPNRIVPEDRDDLVASVREPSDSRKPKTQPDPGVSLRQPDPGVSLRTDLWKIFMRPFARLRA